VEFPAALMTAWKSSLRVSTSFLFRIRSKGLDFIARAVRVCVASLPRFAMTSITAAQVRVARSGSCPESRTRAKVKLNWGFWSASFLAGLRRSASDLEVVYRLSYLPLIES